MQQHYFFCEEKAQPPVCVSFVIVIRIHYFIIFFPMSSNDNQDDTLAATAEASLLPPPQQHCTESPPVAAMLDPIHATQDSATKRSPQRVSWDDRLTMLRAFREQHGHLLIPIRYKQNPSLGKFVHNMREQYKLFHHQVGYKKKCSLTPERIEQLNELGFVWSTERRKRQREDWDKRYEQLKEYKAKHGVSACVYVLCLISMERHSLMFWVGLFGATWICGRSGTFATRVLNQ